MADGFHVDLYALERAAAGVNGTLNEVNKQQVTDIPHDSSAIGCENLASMGIARNAAGPDQVNVMNSDSGGGGGWGAEPDYQTNPGSIANKTGYSRRQINDAIHAVKGQGGWRGLGGNKNPDVVVDTTTGEVYPQLSDGGAANDIYDYLPEEE